MAQMPDRPCPNCDTRVPGSQRFCSNCGTAIELTQPSSHTPMPIAQPFRQPAEQAVPGVQQYPPSPQGNQQIPSYAQSQPSNTMGAALGGLAVASVLGRGQRRAMSGRRRFGLCGVISMLLVLVILGGIGFFVFKAGASFLHQNSGGGSSTGNNSGNATQPPITTAQINAVVTYASLDITVINAQQSQTFIDDQNAQTTGLVRLNLKEQSPASGGIFAYSDRFHLLLPDKTSAPPLNEQFSSSPDQGTTRANWIDFVVPMSDKISQLTLRIGADSEAQIDVPLTGHADLTQYASKTASPNVAAKYVGLTWTVTSATSALSNSGKQANMGMLYITVLLRVDNPSASEYINSASNYIRLKVGGITSPPTSDSTLPSDFLASSAGTTGNVIFVMPRGDTSYTLIFLADPSNQASEATLTFQVG